MLELEDNPILSFKTARLGCSLSCIWNLGFTVKGTEKDDQINDVFSHLLKSLYK